MRFFYFARGPERESKYWAVEVLSSDSKQLFKLYVMRII